MEVLPVPDHPALRVHLEDDGTGASADILIVAELHVGLETTMSRAGAHVRSSTMRMAEGLVELAAQTSVDRVIVAGDLKQTIPDLTWQERREVPQFLQKVSDAVPIHIVLGNHDGDLRLLVPPILRDVDKVQLFGPEGIRIGPADGGGIGIFHGHAWPSAEVLRAEELVSAHTHPGVALVDDMGHAHIERCWVRGPLQREAIFARYPDSRAHTMTLVPPFNALLGGAAVNVDGLLGPAGKMMELERSDLFLLDGTRLGNVGQLPPVPDGWRKRHRKPKAADL